MAKKITLTYFPIGGSAEQARFALEAGKIEYEDKRINYEEFLGIKPTLPSGQLPIIDVDGQVISQSAAILRYCGKITGFYSEDAVEAAKIDAMVDYINKDAMDALSVSSYPKKFGLEPHSDEQKLALRSKIASDTFVTMFGRIEEVLKASKNGWLVGERLTIADFALSPKVQWIESGILDGIPKTFFADNGFTNIIAHNKKVRSNPEIAAYLQKHQK